MDKRKAIIEIERICNEAGLHYILFEDKVEMQELLNDMRRGANLKAGYQALGLPVMKEYLL